MRNNLQKSLKKYDNSISKEPMEIFGDLGIIINGEQVVEVPNRNAFVYVRIRGNLSEVAQVFNDKVSPVYDLPVILVRNGNKYVIKGRNVNRYSNWGSFSSFLPRHGNTHSYTVGGGGDITWVAGEQFMPLMVFPSGTRSAELYVSPTILQRETDFVYVGNVSIGDVARYRPTNNQAIMGLVYLDTVSGNPGFLIASGTPFAASITGSSQVVDYLPYPADPQMPLYGFRLTSGSSTVSRSDLYDVRQYFGGAAGGGSVTPGGGDTDVQFNDGGVLGGSSHFRYDSDTDFIYLENMDIEGVTNGVHSGLHISGGDSTDPGSDGGGLELNAGNGNASYGGNLDLYSGDGDGSGNSGGDLSIWAGDGDTNADGGNIYIDAGTGIGTGSVGGNIEFGAGAGSVGATAGNIIFKQFPYTPSSAPTLNYQVANKKYVDDNKTNPPYNSASFTGTYWTDLTDGGTTTLHSHAVNVGTGTAGRIVQWGAAGNTLVDAALIAPVTNILTLTNTAVATLGIAVSAGKTLTLTAADNFNLTIPATGIAALLGTANVFTTQQMVDGTSDQIQLRVQGHSTQTANLQTWENSGGTVLGLITPLGALGLGATPSDTTTIRTLRIFTPDGTTASTGLLIDQRVNTTANSNQVHAGLDLTMTQQGTENYTAVIGIRGLVFRAVASSSGNTTGLVGCYGNARNTASGTVISAWDYYADVLVNSGGGAITNSYAFFAGNKGGAGVTNAYGLYLSSQSGAATLNYAIYTNAGLNQLGDQLKIDGSADRIQLIVQGHSTQATNLSEWQSSAAAVLVAINGVGVFLPLQAATASAPTYVKGGVYFDTTLNKLRVGGATAWETITSA